MLSFHSFPNHQALWWGVNMICGSSSRCKQFRRCPGLPAPLIPHMPPPPSHQCRHRTEDKWRQEPRGDTSTTGLNPASGARSDLHLVAGEELLNCDGRWLLRALQLSHFFLDEHGIAITAVILIILYTYTHTDTHIYIYVYTHARGKNSKYHKRIYRKRCKMCQSSPNPIHLSQGSPV